MKSDKSSTRTTFGVMLLTFGSRLLGFVRNAFIAQFFGANDVADVLHFMYAFPNNLRKLLAEGSLSSAFIPTLSKHIVENDQERARALASRIISLQMVIIVPLILLFMLFAEPITNIISDFDKPEQIALGAELLRYFISYLFFISIAAILMAVLNSHGHFYISASAPILLSVTVLLSIWFLADSLGVYSVVIGVLSGGIAQVLIQIPLYKKLGYPLGLNFDFKDEEFHRLMVRWLPVLATSSIFVINQQIAHFFASGLDVGSVAVQANAIVFWQLPAGLFGVSITTVLFPKMSRQGSSGDLKGLADSLQYGIRFLLVLLIPSAIIMGLLGKELLTVLYMRGKFTFGDAVLSGEVLGYFCIGLFSVKAFEFSQRYFYSMKDFKTPFFLAIFVMSIDIVLSLILKETVLRVRGLALALSVSFSLGFLLTFAIAVKRIGYFPWKGLFQTLWKVAIVSIVLAAGILFTQNLAGDWWVGGFTLSSFSILMAYGLLTWVFVIFVYKLLGVEMINHVIRRRSST
jgi:putative peptidoglycan lipid II flippase